MKKTDRIYARISLKNIDMLTKIIEGYDHLGIVSTVNGHAGLVVVRVTPDTCQEIRQILEHLPFPIEIVS